VLGLVLASSARAGPVGSWSPLPSMTTPRYGAVAAALSDGRVLVAGGRDGSASATASAEIYDPAVNAWSSAAPMANARVFAAAAPLSGDRVLVTGGDVGGAPSASAEIYDAASNTWSAAAPMAYARAQASAVTLSNGTVWMTGGNENGATEIYDPTANSWSILDWVESLAGQVAVPVSDDQVLLAGGYVLDGGSSLNPYWGLSSPPNLGPSNDGTLSSGPYLASAATMTNGEVLMAGGSQSESSPAGTSTAEIIDPSLAFGWSTVAPMSTARYGAVAALLPDGDVLVAGGEGDSGALASAEEFTPPTLTVPTAPEIQNGAWPIITGSVAVGNTLWITPGTAPAYQPGETQSLQWQRCFSSCEDVNPVNWGGYPVTAADEGATIQVVETVTWERQTASVVSNALGPVQPGGFHLEAGTLQGLLPELSNNSLTYLPLPVIRDSTSGAGVVSYRAWDPTGAGYPALTPVSGTLVFVPGQSTADIIVPLTVNGAPIMPAAISVQLSDGSPPGVVDPSEETVTIRSPDDSLYVRNPANPLGLPTTPPAGNPLGGGAFFADYFQSLTGRTALAWSASYPSLAAKVEVIAREPNTQRFGAWNGLDPAYAVSTYLDRVASEKPGTVPMISTYRLVYGHCGHWSDPRLEQDAYHDFISGLAQGIGAHPAVLFLEMDSLITVGCLSPQGVSVRMHELRDAISVLANDPHLVVYLDAGAADALPARRAASLLRRAGVAGIQGFFLNSTHFDWTSREIRYGQQISRLVGGKHFVVNTAENGQGPLRPRHVAREGNEVLCDPVGRGLGPLPTASTGYPKVDAFAWIANPGVSGGTCRAGAPPSGVFWPSLALELVRHEDFAVR
jgi:endoglucanase